ncbi:MAG TPA: 30S ribosomal protein S12 methylthiotransferase RimO [Planctomycetota bacterium]|nr:30S ribosomal protein S12 methylthiotransferase RimO [Planctomycetota bacterium]
MPARTRTTSRSRSDGRGGSRPRPRAGRAAPSPEPASRSVCLVSLGCSKALVDTEVMGGHLARAGLALVGSPEDSDVVIINTCGFIDEAREESLATVRHYAAMKRAGTLRGVVVTGCLVQLHESQLRAELPDVDAFLPISDYSGVPSIVDALLGHAPSDVCAGGEAGRAPLARAATDAGVATGRASAARSAAAAAPVERAPLERAAPERAPLERAAGDRAPGGMGYPTREIALPGGLVKQGDSDLGRALLTARHTAYLRLGEGCNHVCAFCAIPKIRGKLKSKPLAVLVEEAGALAQLGVRELTLIAEDSTDWGKDLPPVAGRGQGLPDLLLALGDVPDLPWVRVMYAHPATIDQRLIETLAAVRNVVPYLDMPVQHGDESVLRRMRRGTSPARIREVVGALRAAIPGITLRTTILVGFPGETEAAFGHLLELLAELAFDRVGCFVFSAESSTEAFRLDSAVPRALAEERRAQVMGLQRSLLTSRNLARRGSRDLVLVDAVERAVAGSGRLAIGRTATDAPEIDGRVLVELPVRAARGVRDVQPGDFLSVRITGAKGYDLTAALDTGRPSAP